MANASAALQALGDPTRRQIFEQLARRPLAVVDIAKEMPVSRPAVSQHLKVLKDAGLLAVHQQGTRRLYTIDPKGVETMRKYLDGLWDKALTSYAAFVEAEEEDS